MATGAEWNCPICRETSSSIAYVGSCLHQFCLVCIVRWATKNPSCPLCRETVRTILYPASPGHGYVETPLSEPSLPLSAGLEEEEPGAAGPQPPTHVAGFPPGTWAFSLSNHAEILRPLELWLNEALCGTWWWDGAFAQGRILASLCRHGLHEGALARELRPLLQWQTAAFVMELIQVAAERCMDAGSEQGGPSSAAFPGSSWAQAERREGPGQAGSSGAGPSGRAAWQPGRRRGGGAEHARAAHTKACGRQN